MFLKKSTLIPVLLSISTLQVHAQQLDCSKSYGFRADVNDKPGVTLCGSNVNTFIDSAKNFTLSNSGYTETSAAMAQGRFNDVNLILSFGRGSPALTYNFPELGMSGTFSGPTRQASEDQFVEFLKKGDILGKVLHYQAEHTASSALTGVGGLIPMLGSTDFASGFDTASKIATGESGTPNNLIGVGLGYGSYNIDGGAEKVKTTSLPLSYTYRSSDDARRQIVFSLPIMEATTGNAHAYNFGVGVAVRLPVTDRWTVGPGIRYSAVASKDRAALSTVESASLMSTYVIPFDHVDLAIGNMVGIYKTGKFQNGDYSFDPDIKLKMTRNGLMASIPVSLFAGELAAEFSLIDTRYLGEKPFVSNSQEIGVTIGTNRSATNKHSFLRAGISYVRSNAARGITANVGYWF
jgi:opacity protein-like surface antigen